MVKVTYLPTDGKKRCEWCLKDDLYVKYHDEEWGQESHDDQHLFEHLILETFQAGLSWHIILKKREAFREAFEGFDAYKMARYDEIKIRALLQNAGIVRSEAKIRAAINNASRYLEVISEFGSFDQYIWQFTQGTPLKITVRTKEDIQTTTPQSDAMARDLKNRGFKFVGSTTCMAYMEAVGMVRDHYTHCFLADS